MNDIKIVPQTFFSGTSEELKRKFDDMIHCNYDETTFANTEAAVTWIIRGCIDYFFTLDEDFLGSGNESGIPEPKADHFANNIYRLTNAINYLAGLWKIKINKPEGIKLLLDIRTLIVHSGEPVSDIASLELKEYKDNQLGRIFSRYKRGEFYFNNEFSEMDYCIQIWNDKHDKKKQYHKSEVDYHIRNESYLDVSIYLKHDDIRHIVLSYINEFLNRKSESQKTKKIKKLPSKIKNKIINKETHEIDFNKIADLIRYSTRGGYLIENKIEHWNGFGLERLYIYTKSKIDIPIKAREFILDTIENAMLTFWDDYQNEEILNEEIIDLDVRRVFGEYTPSFELKGYLERQKLFINIAPFFNARNRHDQTDIDYLVKFINEVNNALEKTINLEQSVDGLICDYFVQSILKKN